MSDGHLDGGQQRMDHDEEGTFRLFSDSGEKVLAECPKCGRVLTILRDRASTTDDGYSVQGGVRCPCGSKGGRVSKGAPKGPSRSGSSRTGPPKVRCPKCRSEQVSGGRKGFGLGKAAAGGLLVGPVGLVAGMFGRKKPTVTCLNCGHRWEPGRG
ncbi:MAG: hypothetical protein HKO65_10600 [Gemmatimonadetes bacterium]|nr:hypothetical protein [Gemmatimonadota bacterium]NNM05543.1 hypothetical protein [Gemmatimonadota bacterium]